MQGTFVNCLLSAIVGVIAAAGTTWYLAEHSAPEENAPTNLVESEQAAVKEVKELVVDSPSSTTASFSSTQKLKRRLLK